MILVRQTGEKKEYLSEIVKPRPFNYFTESQ